MPADGKFYRFALVPEFSFSVAEQQAATKFAFSSPYLPGISETSIDIVACWTHEIAHYLQFTTYPPCIAAFVLDEQVHGFKLDILKEHGRRHWAKDQDRYKGIYRSDELDPDVFASYQIMNQARWWRDLILDFGRYPLSGLREFTQIAGRRSDRLQYSASGFILPTVSVPNDDQIDSMLDLPSFNSLIEAFACVYELGFLFQPEIHSKHGQAVAQRIQTSRLGKPGYHAVPRLLSQSLGIGLGDPLALAIIDLTLCGPSITSGDVSWTEFHPVTRLKQIIEVAKSLRLERHTATQETLSDYVRNFHEIVCRELKWRSSVANLKACKEGLIALFGTAPPPGKQYDRLLVDRICANLDAKLSEPAFPIKLKRDDHIQPPVQIFGPTLQMSLLPRERDYVFLCLAHTATKFISQYLISANETDWRDEVLPRRFFALVHKFVQERFAPEFRSRVLSEFPPDYDDFVAKIEAGEFY